MAIGARQKRHSSRRGEAGNRALVQMARSDWLRGPLIGVRSVMSKLKIAEELFKGRYFDRGIVIQCVR
jgi:hypothetical protein